MFGSGIKNWVKMGKRWFGLTCGARQRAATGVSLHELMELGGGRAGGREGGRRRRGEGHWERRLTAEQPTGLYDRTEGGGGGRCRGGTQV